jgi:hypothetical protein
LFYDNIDSPGFSSGLFIGRFEVPEKRRGFVVIATLPVVNRHVAALVMPMPGVILALRDAGRFRPPVLECPPSSAGVATIDLPTARRAHIVAPLPFGVGVVRKTPHRFSRTNEKMRAALGEGRPRAYRSGDGVGWGT